MARQREPIVLSWSGGKDSAMMLHELRRLKEFEVVGLMTAVDESTGRVTMHRVKRDLLAAQARSLDLPIEFVDIPDSCTNHIYNDRLAAALSRFIDAGVRHVAFGDLFLDDIRDFREECLEGIGMEAEFPLWHRCTKDLAWSFINLKYKAVVTCVDQTMLPAAYAGRNFDRAFLSDLPLDVDPCGENGEFHTFVYEGPALKDPIPIKLSAVACSDARFHYCELKSRAASARPTLIRAKLG